MGMKISNLLKNDIFYIFIVSLMIGLILGFCTPRKYYVKFQMFMHDIYIKHHPEVKKDAKTIIIETATKNVKKVPQTSIFEED